MEIKYLVMVTADNHNKYYKMIPGVPSPQHFTVEYGRIGATCAQKVYPISRFDAIYEEKLSKGYVDQSDLHNPTTVTTRKWAPIADASVEWLVNTLLDAAGKAFASEYVCTIDEVTSEMTSAAQNLILKMQDDISVDSFNSLLLELFSVIPRKMANVNESMAKEKNDFLSIIEREQALLEFTNGQVRKSQVQKETAMPDSTYLDSIGVDITECDEKESAEVLRYMKRDPLFNPRYFYKAFRVVNHATEARFQLYLSENGLDEKKDTRMYYHGSNNRNWDGLIANGPLLNPNATVCGKMFGQGIYFAHQAEKSRRYTSMCDYVRDVKGSLGFIGVYKVAMKNPLHVKGMDFSKCWSRLTPSDMKKMGKDALYAHSDHGVSLYNDEIVIFQEEQISIRYIVALKD